MPEITAPPTTSSPPDWSQISEEILCPLCDYNLRGLIEPRCPECGYSFSWNELLDPARRRHPYLFEHHPERNYWSFWKTLTGGLRPRKFWKSLQPTQPSRPSRLIRYWCLTACFLLPTAITPVLLLVPRFNNQSRAARANITTYLNDPAHASAKDCIIRQFGSVRTYLATMYPPLTLKSAWQLLRERGILAYMGPYQLQSMLLALLWPWLTFLALLVFRWSMRKAKIKTIHVLRCVLYSFDAGPWVGLVCLIWGVLAVAGLDWGTVLLFAIPVFCLYRLVIAYKYCLRFHLPTWTILAAQVVVALVYLNGILAWKYW